MLKDWRSFYFGLWLAPLLAMGQTSPAPVESIPAITNWPQITKDLQLDRYKGRSFARKLKIAILDNGFAGYEKEIGKTLPKSTVYHPGKSSAADNVQASYHGLMKAQLLAGVIERAKVQADYELHLFNSFGYTKFADAVRQVIDGQFDLVLYSQVWEFGGNGDGKGFINKLVEEAVKAGVIWINAAGDFGKLTYLGPVEGQPGGWLTFRDHKGRNKDHIEVICKSLDKRKRPCRLRLVASWNDFKDDPNTGTDKDLDLFVFTKNKQVASAERRQRSKPAEEASATISYYPRELLVIELPAGSHQVKIKMISSNFNSSIDRVRVTASNWNAGSRIEMSAAMYTDEETLLPPADLPGVIVIGASDDFQSSRSVSRKEPQIHLNSLLRLADKSDPHSTSVSAALAAGVAAIELGLGTPKTREAVLEKLKVISKAPKEFKRPEPKAVAKREPKQIRSKSYEVADPSPRRPLPRRPSRDGEGWGGDRGGQYPSQGWGPRGQGPMAEKPYYNEAPSSYEDLKLDPYRGDGPRRLPSEPGYPIASPAPIRPPLWPPQEACLSPHPLPVVYPQARTLLNSGQAIPLFIGGRSVIAVNFDYPRAVGLPPLFPNQRLFLTPRGHLVLTNVSRPLPPGFYEIMRIPFQRICR